MKSTNDTVVVGPRLRIIHATGRWGEPAPYWYVPPTGTISVEMWEKIQDFQRDVRPVPEGVDRVEYYRGEFGRKIGHNPEKSLLWQFNLQTKIGAFDSDQCSEFVRAIAAFGEKRIVPRTWFDVHVKSPVLRAVAWVLTKLRYNPEF